MKGGAPAAAGCMPAPILAAPPSAPSPCSNGGAAISAPHSRRQEGSSRGPAPSLRWRSTPNHPPFACCTRLGERDARGRLCRAPGFPRPVEARMMPPFMYKRGRDQEGSGGGSCTHCPLRPERGRGRERARAYLCAPLYTPCLCTMRGAARKGRGRPLGTARATLRRTPLPPPSPGRALALRAGKAWWREGARSLATSPTRRPIPAPSP